ncbi:MAG: oligosaccharide flippase family protein [Lachnospiraceae bacterium]|nr:oligosaccharide flippase family protein [Lachnospiraceae bacterium]
MEKRSIKKNYIYNTLYQILLLLTPFITTPYISRVLGADGVGTVSYAESIVSYFTLFAAMGVTTYGQREISYVQDSCEKRSIVFWNTKCFMAIISGIVILFYLLFASRSENSTIYYILLFNLLAVLVDVTWFFQGIEEFGKIVFRNVILKIISIIYIFIAVKTADDIVRYVFGLTFFTFVGNLSLWFYVPKYVKFVKKEEVHPFKSTKAILGLFVPTIAIQIYTVLDKTMIGILTKSAYENGYYEQAIKIVRMVLMLVASLGTVMVPRIGYYFQNGKKEDVQRLMYRAYRFVWLLGIPLCFGLIMISANFVPWFFGEGYDKVISLISILSFLILAIGINNVTGIQYLIPTQKENIFSLTVIIGACVNFIFNLILIPRIQSEGAAIASVIAETVIAIVQIIIVRKELHPLRIIKEGTNYFIAGLVMVVALYIEGECLESSMLNTLIMITTGALSYGVVLLLLRDFFVLNNIKMILQKIKIIK